MGRREGGQAGRPGRNSLPFVGKVLGHGRTYEEGGEDRRADMGKLSKVPDGVYTQQASTEGGLPTSQWGYPLGTRYSVSQEESSIKLVSQAESVSQSASREESVSKSVR